MLDKDFVYWVPQTLDIDAMRAAAGRLVGTHDFSSFRTSECQAKSPVKTLDKIEIMSSSARSYDLGPAVKPLDDKRIVIEFSAQSFLHHQVRNIVGTLVEIGRGKPYDIDEVLNARSRAVAGPTAPADGLFFISAEY